MWGNALGWVISSLLVLAMGGFVYVADRAGKVSPPTEFALIASKAPPLDIPVAHSILSPSTDRGDAGPLYHQAIQAYQSDPAKYQRFNDRGKSEDIEKLDGL